MHEVTTTESSGFFSSTPIIAMAGATSLHQECDLEQSSEICVLFSIREAETYSKKTG